MHFEMFGASVLVGLMSGWLAGVAMKGGGYGLLWDTIFGLSGSFVGSWIFQSLGAPEAGWGGTGIAAFAGAALMITFQRKIWPAQVAHAWERDPLTPSARAEGFEPFHEAWRQARGALRRAGVSKRGGGGNVRE